MRLSFIKAIHAVDLKNYDDIETIYDAVEDRYSVLEMQEPYGSSDFFYEKWEEKFSEFEYLRDDFEDLNERFKELLLDDEENAREEIDNDAFEELKSEYQDWVSRVEDYQYDFGGLKRLMVFL